MMQKEHPTPDNGEKPTSASVFTKVKALLFSSFVPDTSEKDVPKNSVRLVWYSAASIIILLIWAGLAQIDQIARGLGQVVPSQRVQLIQNLEGGIVQDILVHEGQTVEKGTIVLRIDNEMADSQYREAQVRSLELQASIARLEALIHGGDPKYSEDVQQEPTLMHRQNDMLRASRTQNTSEIDVLTLRAEATSRQLAELKEVKQQSLKALSLVQRQRDLALPALRSKAYSEVQFLDIEQRLQSIKTELAGLEHSIPRLEATAKETAEQVRLRKAELESQYRRELNEAQVQLLSLRELITAGGDKVQRTEMRSPVNGIIKAIYANTVGGVVAPGATVMEIVPLDDTLIIEGRFNPADIAFLYPGQQALVRITAYDFSIYGGMKAHVETISADTLQDQQGTTYYKVKVRTEKAHLSHGEQNLPIIPGMQAEVDILTGKKTILDYLLKPLLKAQQRAFREK